MEKIIERIRKLIRLSQDQSASDGERDNALRMISSTLAKYNLSMSDIEEKEDRGKSIEKFYGRPWARTVAKYCAKLFFCEYYSVITGQNHIFHCFIGEGG